MVMMMEPSKVVAAAHKANAVYLPCNLETNAVEMTGPTRVPGAARDHIKPSLAPAWVGEICATHDATVAMHPPDARP